MKWFKRVFLGVSAVAFCLGVLVALLAPDDAKETASVAPQPGPTAESPWLTAAGNIWPGVSLYHGTDETKRLVGRVIDADGETVRVKYPSGSIEPKHREAIVVGGWYVRRDDPALWENRSH